MLCNVQVLGRWHGDDVCAAEEVIYACGALRFYEFLVNPKSDR